MRGRSSQGLVNLCVPKIAFMAEWRRTTQQELRVTRPACMLTGPVCPHAVTGTGSPWM
jgi:hypothetical protein